jgi:hypothetical protein
MSPPSHPHPSPASEALLEGPAGSPRASRHVLLSGRHDRGEGCLGLNLSTRGGGGKACRAVLGGLREQVGGAHKEHVRAREQRSRTEVHSNRLLLSPWRIARWDVADERCTAICRSGPHHRASRAVGGANHERCTPICRASQQPLEGGDLSACGRVGADGHSLGWGQHRVRPTGGSPQPRLSCRAGMHVRPAPQRASRGSRRWAARVGTEVFQTEQEAIERRRRLVPPRAGPATAGSARERTAIRPRSPLPSRSRSRRLFTIRGRCGLPGRRFKSRSPARSRRRLLLVRRVQRIH